MRLAAIYNAWDGLELLPASMKSIHDNVDLIIIVYQTVSNFGEKSDDLQDVMSPMPGWFKPVRFVKYDPIISMGGSLNERAKRNLGLDEARKHGCTHFIGMDVDELYEDFGAAKQLYIDSGHSGSVCRLQTYFRKPTFRFDTPENYYVPFIHKLTPDTKSGSSSYPFYVDPTRAINDSDVVELPIFMHHFSWCRLDIMRKARNSSAKIQIQKGNILSDYNSPDLGEGYFLTNFNRKITVCEDLFDLSKIFD